MNFSQRKDSFELKKNCVLSFWKELRWGNSAQRIESLFSGDARTETFSRCYFSRGWGQIVLVVLQSSVKPFYYDFSQIPDVPEELIWSREEMHEESVPLL